MIPIPFLGQVYLASAILGVGFILFNFAMGQLGDGADTGPSDAGHDFGATDGGASGGHDFGANDDGGSSSPTNSQISMHQLQITHGGRLLIPGADKVRSKFGQLVLGLLSPMGIAIYLAFFGLTGMILFSMMPWLSWITLIIANFASLAIANSFKNSVRWMAKHLDVSSELKMGDLVGQIAEVNIPFGDGSTGEVTYVVHSKLYNSPAKPFKSGNFKRGSKVMIVEVQNSAVLVEPYLDYQLDSSFSASK
jgi:membrane protein implicated in regulation of membrane protease activity